ncbi:MAG: hypothetical protein WCI73_00130 [Phycisphaerae bacterium]
MLTKQQQLFRDIVMANKLMPEPILDLYLTSVTDPEAAIHELHNRNYITDKVYNSFLKLYRQKARELSNMTAKPSDEAQPAVTGSAVYKGTIHEDDIAPLMSPRPVKAASGTLQISIQQSGENTQSSSRPAIIESSEAIVTSISRTAPDEAMRTQMQEKVNECQNQLAYYGALIQDIKSLNLPGVELQYDDPKKTNVILTFLGKTYSIEHQFAVWNGRLISVVRIEFRVFHYIYYMDLVIDPTGRVLVVTDSSSRYDRPTKEKSKLKGAFLDTPVGRAALITFLLDAQLQVAELGLSAVKDGDIEAKPRWLHLSSGPNVDTSISKIKTFWRQYAESGAYLTVKADWCGSAHDPPIVYMIPEVLVDGSTIYLGRDAPKEPDEKFNDGYFSFAVGQRDVQNGICCIANRKMFLAEQLRVVSSEPSETAPCILLKGKIVANSNDNGYAMVCTSVVSLLEKQKDSV